MNPVSKGRLAVTDIFLSLGECMVELAPQDGGLFAMGFAGDTFNTAWYARRLLPPEWRVSYLTAVGSDAISDRMLGFMAAARIDTGAVARHPDRTVGLYMISLNGAERSFSYWRSVSAARSLADDPDRLAGAFTGVRMVYLSGITLAILDDAGRGRLRAALSRARQAGTEVAFDPNLRPRLWPDEAQMCAVVSEFAALSDIVLPSHEDEARHFGDASAEQTLERYRAGGAGLVVVKDGPGPVLAASTQGRWRHLPAAVARVVDTTAAGDSFNAGFLSARLTGADMGVALAAGAGLAAQVIGARGALVEVSP
jgi:2-dehydro-3-deoxygluconokinase